MTLHKNILSGPDCKDFKTSMGLVPTIFYNLKKATSDEFAINVDTGEVITYEQLWHKAIRLASALQSLGSHFGKVVAIVGENNLEVYSFYFAAIFTGATVGCINHTLVSDEINQLLNLLKPDFVFCTKDYFEKTKLALKDVENNPFLVVPDGTAPYLNYNDLLTHDPNAFTLPTLPSWDEHVFAILFSSGTTGLPKGALLRDRGFQYIQNVIPSNLKRIMTQCPISTGSSIVFLTAAAKLMGTYICGGKSNTDIIAALRKYKPSFWFTAPTNLLKLAQEPSITHEDFSSIEKLFASGSGLTRDQVIYLNKKLFNNRIGLNNSYNCIETLSITDWPSGSDLVHSPKIGSVGKVQPLVHLKVVDRESGEILGPNRKGELFVKSPFIMTGYINNPEETNKVLDAEGWYRTGDIGFYDLDEYVYITGRVKDIFKCMNRQVSPMQLEAILESHPAVFEAAVTGKPHPIDGCHPIAFVILKKNIPPIDENELLKFVNDQVAEYRKLHGGLYFVDYLPKNPAGKKLRRSLLETFCP